MLTSRKEKTILLTGAAGVFGDSLLKELIQKHRVLCLVRKHPVQVPGAEIVYGDICQPLLGMHANTYASLLNNVDWVIHSAAVTRLDGDAETIRRVNYSGTQNIIKFAEIAAVPLYHISTAFAPRCEYHAGVTAETPYEVAKRDAEKLVRDAGIRAAIFRPSIVIGESTSGFIPTFQGFHMTLGLAMSGVLPLVPCPENAYVDFISRDVAAQAVSAALQREIIAGEYNLSSGPHALIVSELFDLLEARAKSNNENFDRPKSIDPDVFERLVKPAFLPGLHEELRNALLRASLMCRYASLKTPLTSSLHELLPHLPYDSGVAAAHLARSLEFIAPKISAFRRMLKVSTKADVGAPDKNPEQQLITKNDSDYRIATGEYA